jgi:hypothetical protein
LHLLRHALGQLADRAIGGIAQPVRFQQFAPAPAPSFSGTPRSEARNAIASVAFIAG